MKIYTYSIFYSISYESSSIRTTSRLELRLKTEQSWRVCRFARVQKLISWAPGKSKSKSRLFFWPSDTNILGTMSYQ